jgi:3-methyladenine DNA glycosylase Mpg
MNSYIKKEKHNYNFKKLANLLLNRTVFKVNKHKFRPAEIEFYLYSEDHPDSYVHCHEDQLKYGFWYFHKTGKSYKGGTFKGLDLCLGEEDTYFGILIRSIYDIQEEKLIEGPCNCVNRILAVAEVESIKDFVDQGYQIKIRDEEHDEETIYRGPRIGLSDKYPKYQYKKYRYAIMKELIKNQKTSLIKLV